MTKANNIQMAEAIAYSYNHGIDNYGTAKLLGISYQGFMYRLKKFKEAGVTVPDLKLSKKLDVQKINSIISDGMNHVALPLNELSKDTK